MRRTLKISLSEDQKNWLVSRRDSDGFFSISEVVRDLIRSRQRQEQAESLARFKELDRYGSDEPEPTEAVLALVRRVKRKRRKADMN